MFAQILRGSEIVLATSAIPLLKGEPLSPEFIRSIEAAVEVGVKILTLRFFFLGDKAPDIQERFTKEIIPSFNT